MTELVAITIPGNPRPKQRPRLGKGGNTYTPKATRVAENGVATLLQNAMPGPPTDKPVAVCLRFHRDNHRRADLDNLVKLVLDAANGVVWRDDAQVEQIHARLTRGDEAETRITVSEFPDDA